MKERPILFSEPMVRAILAGTKQQTRRVIKPQPDGFVPCTNRPFWLAAKHDRPTITCPYGQPGDRLWVRETWRAFFDDEVPPERPRGPRHTLGQPSRPDRKSFVFYKADGPGPVHPDGFPACWHSAIYMPRKYSRITLEITGVRVERLQDISNEDARAEGVLPAYADQCVALGHQYEARPLYRELWQHINGPGSWDANPWVWVLEFKRV